MRNKEEISRELFKQRKLQVSKDLGERFSALLSMLCRTGIEVLYCCDDGPEIKKMVEDLVCTLDKNGKKLQTKGILSAPLIL